MRLKLKQLQKLQTWQYKVSVALSNQTAIAMQKHCQAALKEKTVMFMGAPIPPSILKLMEMHEAGCTSHGNGVTEPRSDVPILTQCKSASACYWIATYCLKANEGASVSACQAHRQ